MAVRPRGVLRLGQRDFGPSQLLVMAVAGPTGDPVATMERVHTVVAEGADIVEIRARTGGEIDEREVVTFAATLRAAYPELVVGVSTGRREVAGQACAAGAADLLSWDVPDPSGARDLWLAEVAAEFGASVVCPPSRAAQAVAAGVKPERVVVGVAGTAGLASLVATGWPVLVSLPEEDLARGLATAAAGAWLGARVFRVPWIGETRRVLRMVSAIRGDIPPACAVRGLALFPVRFR